MPSLIHRLVAVGIVGLIALGVAVGWRSRGGVRYAAAQASATAGCRAYRAEPGHAAARICQAHDEFGPRATDLSSRAEAKLDEAQAKLEASARDPRGAEIALASALNTAEALDRFGSMLGTILAAKIVDRTLDLLAKSPDVDRRRVLGRTSLEAARRPLEGTRIHHLWLLAHWADFPDATDVSKATLADTMEADDAAYREMERALLDGDAERCRVAAQTVGAANGSGSGLARVACDRLGPVVSAARRLEEARPSGS